MFRKKPVCFQCLQTPFILGFRRILKKSETFFERFQTGCVLPYDFCQFVSV